MINAADTCYYEHASVHVSSMNEIFVFFHSVKIGLVCFRKPFNAFTV